MLLIMKTKTFFLLFVAILGTSACTQKPVINKDLALVDSLAAIAVKSWGSGDINQVVSIYAADAIVISGEMKMCGKDSITAGWKEVVPFAKNFTFHKGFSSVTSDMIFAEGLYTFDWHRDNYSALAKGLTTLVWKKQPDGSWKITFQIEEHGDLVKK
jgi:ketosteroid isomerase-like protein